MEQGETDKQKKRDIPQQQPDTRKKVHSSFVALLSVVPFDRVVSLKPHPLNMIRIFDLAGYIDQEHIGPESFGS